MHQHGFEQVTTLAVLHDNVNALSIFKGGVELSNIGPIQGSHGLYLAVQLVEVLRVHLVLVVCFDDNFVAGGIAHCFIDG